MLKRTNGVITHETFQKEINEIEENLKNNIKVSRKMVNEFKTEIDDGDMCNLAYLYVLEKNFENATKAYNDFIGLPLTN